VLGQDPFSGRVFCFRCRRAPPRKRRPITERCPVACRPFTPYVGGVTAYKKKRDEVAASGYQGFHFGASFAKQAAAN
jgi:hypothetical protein